MAVSPDNSTLIIPESHGKRLTALGRLGPAAAQPASALAPTAPCATETCHNRCVRVREGGEALQTIRWITHTELASADPGSVHVADTRAAFDKALLEGAEEMVPPTRVMEGVAIAVVRAPGGVPIGFSGP